MHTRKAITFIELLIVCAIIGIFVGVSLPRFRATFNSLQLENFSAELQNFMLYLRQRSIVTAKTVILNIDSAKREYWAKVENETNRLKTQRFPAALNIESESEQIAFYPDGSIDKVTIKLMNANQQQVNLTTKGIFGGVKLQAKE